jgi:hypothetical protein
VYVPLFEFEGTDTVVVVVIPGATTVFDLTIPGLVLGAMLLSRLAESACGSGSSTRVSTVPSGFEMAVSLGDCTV